MNKVVPQNVDAERDVLGAMLLKTEVIPEVLSIIKSPDYFYTPKHRHIFSAITDLFKWKEVADLTTVSNELGKKKSEGSTSLLEAVGNRVYIVELTEYASVLNVKQHAKIVEEKYLYRKIINMATEVIVSAENENQEPITLMTEFTQEVMELSKTREERTFKKIGSLIPSIVENLEQIQNNEEMRGISYGFIDIDAKTNGAKGGDLIVLGASSGDGKTALINRMASIQAEKGIRVGVFSAETNEKEYSLRSLCTDAQLDSRELSSGKIGEKDWIKITDSQIKMEKWNYWIDDTPEVEIHSLIAKATKLVQDEDVQILYIDYLTKLSCDTKFKQANETIGYMVRSLKKLAQQLNIPVFLLSQLNRNVDTRRNKRPIMSDLMGSSVISQEADLVSFLYRPEKYAKKNSKEATKWEDITVFIIEKQRNGPTGDIKLYFNKEFTRHEDASYRTPTLPNQEDMPF